ncbi:hypothetical protein N9A28_06965 [Sulfurimonas sp.]|nr:hypothetical protein [Sulfurimonas sp.]
MIKNKINNTCILLLSTFILSGCGVAYTPTSSMAKKAEALPTLTQIEYRKSPEDKMDILSLNIPYKKSKVTQDDFVSRLNIKPGIYPSVILNIPSDKSESTSIDGATNSSATDSQFSTASYYNQAEQEVEKAMMRKGFNVLDRAKFEAKLRDLRDNYAENKHEKISDSARAVQNSLKKQFEDGKIDMGEFQTKMDQLEMSSKRSSAGKNRDTNEMIDISEVIRAAQSGDVKADYLLQINKMEVTPSYDRALDIYNFPETKAFLQDHIGLEIGDLKEDNIPRSIPRPWYRASFNAKLINISNGKIVWIGNHLTESNSANKDGISITFNVKQYVSNNNYINSSIDSYNSQLQSKYDELKRVTSKLNNLYKQETRAMEFKTEDDKTRYISNMHSDISSTETLYSSTLTEYKQLQQERPSQISENWAYKYNVGEPIITPTMMSNENNSPAMEEKIREHKNALIKEVTTALINTIGSKKDR